RPSATSPLFPYTTLFRSAAHALLAPRRPDRQRAHDPRYLSRPAGDGARRDRGYTLRRDILRGGRLGIRLVCRHWRVDGTLSAPRDRKSTRLNSSHEWISY